MVLLAVSPARGAAMVAFGANGSMVNRLEAEVIAPPFALAAQL